MTLSSIYCIVYAPITFRYGCIFYKENCDEEVDDSVCGDDVRLCE